MLKEVTSKKYSEMSGIPEKRVRNWCIDGTLSCRRIDIKGKEIADWRENPKNGAWYVDTTKQIGE